MENPRQVRGDFLLGKKGEKLLLKKWNKEEWHGFTFYEYSQTSKVIRKTNLFVDWVG